MSNVIPFIKPAPPKSKCAFCGKIEQAGERIVIGGDGKPCICSDCVRHAKKRIQEDGVEDAA